MYKKSLKNNPKYFITMFIVGLCFLTTLTSVGFGALSKNLNIAGDIEYVKHNNMIRSWNADSTEDFHSSEYKDKIKTVEFLDNKNIPNTAIEYWDVSVNSDGKVMAWIMDNPEEAGTYNLYIGANGNVVGNPDSSYIFYRMGELVSINFNNKFDTSKAVDMSYMFSYCYHLTNLDVTSFNTSGVTNMTMMFIYCYSLTNIDFSNFNTANVTNMTRMFEECRGFVSLDIKNFNTSNVINMSGMFYNCSRLTSLDLSNFNTNNVTDMSKMFNSCRGLITLNLISFDTLNVTDMNNMFYNCNGLTSLDLSNFNTSNVTNMSYMFGVCSNLTSLDLMHFNTSSVTNMSSMFSRCTGLVSLDLSNFNTSNVVNMSNMFSFENAYEDNHLISINLNGFDTSQVTNMYRMFFQCDNLINLDLSSFNTSSVTNMESMFYYCKGLSQIKISSLWNVSNVTTSSSMFSGCSNLPNYNSRYTGISMAKPTTQGGYLTLVGTIDTFAYEGNTYSFEIGMTWDDWINSSYNTDGFDSLNGFVTDGYNYITEDGSNRVLDTDLVRASSYEIHR